MGNRTLSIPARLRPAALWLGLAAGLTGLAPFEARAALGGDLASVDRDLAHLQAARVVTPTVSYDLHELSSSGTRVREYVDRSGRVFAVSWQGPRMPDLGQLLGAYAERYAAAVRAQQATRSHLALSTPELVLTAIRMPRGWSGQAFLPAALPDGVRREELR
jgi:hypothetical protein